METRSPNGTRERILAAAAEILAEEGATARLSVRAVASRAEVSIGSMRHHFPTQQLLRDQVLERIGDWLAPSEGMHDMSLGATERLVGSLRQVLTEIGTGQRARDALLATVTTFVAVEQTPEVREAHLAVAADGHRRIEGWLQILADEGLVLPADIPRHARFLGAVLNGLALQRALPAPDALARIEQETLEDAVSAVLRPAASA